MHDPDPTCRRARMKSPPAATVASAQIRGAKVLDRRGVHVGCLEDLVIRWCGGAVTHAVLSLGSAFGLGPRMHPVAWDRLAYDPCGRTFTWDGLKSDLEPAGSSLGLAGGETWRQGSDAAVICLPSYIVLRNKSSLATPRTGLHPGVAEGAGAPPNAIRLPTAPAGWGRT